MLSYQHGFHAGGFADVLKHAVQSLLLTAMIRKEKPLFYLETHAGRGVYDLRSAAARKTEEYRSGIDVLWSCRKALPEVFAPYLKVCEAFNSEENLRYYPGSPAFAVALLREIDRLYCCELHPQEYQALARLPKQNRRVHYAHTDGLLALQAMLPPKERRGLIFIDPSFEVKSTYQSIPDALQKAYRRFETGVYCLWYPILDAKAHERLIRGLSALKAPALQIEWSLKGDFPHAMQRCGLWVINPTFGLYEDVGVLLNALKKHFNSDVFLKRY